MTEKEINKMFKECIAYQYWEGVIDSYSLAWNVVMISQINLSKLDKYEIIHNLLTNKYLWKTIYKEIENELHLVKKKND